MAYALLLGVGGLGLLGYTLSVSPIRLPVPAILVFSSLSFLVQRSSFDLGGPVTHSLAGVVDLAAVMALGPGGGACVAALSGFVYLALNAMRHRTRTARNLLLIPVFDAGLKASIALAASWLLAALLAEPSTSGEGWLTVPGLSDRAIWAVLPVSLAWFLLDHLGWGLLDYFEGGLERLSAYSRRAFPQAWLAELLPLPFSVVLALAYARLPWLGFALLALAIAVGALVVRRWAQGRSELTQRVAELTALEQVGRALAQARFDVEQLCQLLYEHASRIADTTLFHVGLFEGDTYVIKLWMQDGNRQPERSFQLEPGVGLVNWMRSSKQALLIRDFEQEMDSLPARPAYVAERPPRSALFVPLMAGETVIGALSTQSFRREAYGSSDVRVLSAMANQAALSMQKAQLYEQERKRARQLETIGQVVRQVSANLDLDELFLRTVRLIRESFGYYHVGIFAADRPSQTVSFQASASAGSQDVVFDVQWGEGVIGWAVANGRSAMVNDVASDSRYRAVDALEETRSELAVALCQEDELVGVLDVQSDRLNAFGSDDLFILETLGAQVAISIREARLYEAEKQQAWVSTALLQVADALSHLSDIDEVLTTIVRLTTMLAGVDRCGILLWDDATETYLPAQAYGLTAEQRVRFEQMLFPPGSVPALDQVRLDLHPLLIHPAVDAELLPRYLIDTFETGEMVALPLVAQAEFLGAMLADYSGQAHRFSDRILAMLSGIANQAAMVIQGARLLQAQQEEAYVSMALLQVADAVSHSSGLGEALASVTRITPMLVGVEACALFLLDKGTGVFLPNQQYGLDKEAQRVFWQLRFSPADPPARDLIAGRPFVSAQNTPEMAEAASTLSQGTLLVLPVAIRGEVVGMMAVDLSDPAQRFIERRIGILSGVAGQAAIAVENDRLLQETAQQERLRQELEVAKRIQTSFLPECCPYVRGWELASIWRAAREVAGDFYDFIPILSGRDLGASEGRTGVVIADVADKGVPAALYMALSRTLLRTMAIAGRPPGTAVAQTNNLILADARADLFVTLFYMILEPDTGDISYVNAGHLPPLLVRSADGRVDELRTGGMALGVLPDQDFEERTDRLEHGDALILYTDGVVEASDAEGRMFGRARLIELAREHRSEPADALAQRIEEAVAAFVGGAPQSDDFTLVVAKRQAPDAEAEAHKDTRA